MIGQQADDKRFYVAFGSARGRGYSAGIRPDVAGAGRDLIPANRRRMRSVFTKDEVVRLARLDR